MSCVHAQPFARFHPCTDEFLLLQMNTEKNISLPVGKKKKSKGEKYLPIVMFPEWLHFPLKHLMDEAGQSSSS